MCFGLFFKTLCVCVYMCVHACVSPGKVGKARPEIVALPMVSCSKMNLHITLWFLGKNKPILTSSQNNNICAALVITTGTTLPPGLLAVPCSQLTLTLRAPAAFFPQSSCSWADSSFWLIQDSPPPRSLPGWLMPSLWDGLSCSELDTPMLSLSSIDLCDASLCGSPSTPVFGLSTSVVLPSQV